MQHSTGYILLFAAAVCAVCSVFVSGAAVSLEGRQIANATLDRQKQVLTVAGLMESGASIDADQAARLFEANIAASVENLSAAESIIRDVDMADEVTQMTKFQILQQAGTAMLAQANAAPQGVLALLR